MSPTIILDLIVSIVAIGTLAALTRLAYLVAGGQFDEAPAPVSVDPADELEWAA